MKEQQYWWYSAYCGEKIYYNSKFNAQTSNEIDLSAFQKGIYFMKIYDGEKTYLKKVAVQ